MGLQIKTFQEYQEKYALSISEPEAFWGDVASHFHWQKKWDSVFRRENG